MAESPDYIASTPSNNESDVEITFTAQNINFSTYSTVQSALFTVTERTGAIQVTINDSNKIRFGSYDGFVLTDNYLNIIKTKTPVVYEEDEDGVISILIELENKNLKLGTCQLWVGEKTTIKANKIYPKQVKFGTPAIENDNTLTGYVRLYSF